MKYFLGFLVAMLTGILTCTGHVQKVISFADPLNEFAFAIMAFTMAILFLITLFSPDEESKRKRLVRRSKIARIKDILLDKSEAFNDNPNYRFQIVKSIWNEKYE